MSIVSNYDSKDATIHRLKLEIEELKKNEKDYSDLSFILTNLEHRYNLLNEEKVIMNNIKLVYYVTKSGKLIIILLNS